MGFLTQGFLWVFLEALRSFSGVSILPPFDHPRHLKSGVPPHSLAIAMTDYNDLVRKNT